MCGTSKCCAAKAEPKLHEHDSAKCTQRLWQARVPQLSAKLCLVRRSESLKNGLRFVGRSEEMWRYFVPKYWLAASLTLEAKEFDYGSLLIHRRPRLSASFPKKEPRRAAPIDAPAENQRTAEERWTRHSVDTQMHLLGTRPTCLEPSNAPPV
eukprot:6193247-Pleurochrysis_carterae.AAC.4